MAAQTVTIVCTTQSISSQITNAKVTALAAGVAKNLNTLSGLPQKGILTGEKFEVVTSTIA